MNEKTTFVGPTRVAQKRARASAIPGVPERAAQARAEMAEADRAYVHSLAAIRHAADLTQVALAEQMGVPQTVVSRIEHQHDMLLSTLTGYLRAAGERPRVIVTINGKDVELDLATLVDLPPSVFPKKYVATHSPGRRAAGTNGTLHNDFRAEPD